MDLSADGRLAATGSGGTWKSIDGSREGGNDFSVRVWALEGQHPTLELVGHTEPLTAVAISPDSRFVASASRDHSVRVWSIRHNRTTALLSGPAEVLSLAYHPSGRKLLSGSWDHATLWDLSTGKAIQDLDCGAGPILAVDISPDGRLAVTATRDNDVLLWELENLDAPPHALPRQDGWVNAVDFSSEGNRLLTAHSSGQISLWDTNSERKIAVFHGTHASANSARFCRQGTEVVVAYEDGTIRLWKVPDSSESP